MISTDEVTCHSTAFCKLFLESKRYFALLKNVVHLLKSVVGFLADRGGFYAVIATVIAQIFAAIYSFICLFKIDFVRFRKGDFVLQTSLCGKLLYMGLPMAAQNVVVSVGGIILQLVVNL